MQNRQIKFRAWDKTVQQWRVVTSLDWYKPISGKTGLCGVIVVLGSGHDQFLPIENVAVVQFTGLIDKNGKEIYEGDVVVKDSYPWFANMNPNYRGTVEWVYSQWQVIQHCVNHAVRGISDGINVGINDEGVEEGGVTDWEVIGNIYENPELLKV